MMTRAEECEKYSHEALPALACTGQLSQPLSARILEIKPAVFEYRRNYKRRGRWGSAFGRGICIEDADLKRFDGRWRTTRYGRGTRYLSLSFSSGFGSPVDAFGIGVRSGTEGER
eukprot:1394949-Amorphochlora_amoeboformis.AAC.2